MRELINVVKPRRAFPLACQDSESGIVHYANNQGSVG